MDEGSVCLDSAEEKDAVAMEFVPLEGADDGVGSFLGIICSQDAFGNLEASEETMKKAIRHNINNLCFQELIIMNDYEQNLERMYIQISKPILFQLDVWAWKLYIVCGKQTFGGL